MVQGHVIQTGGGVPLSDAASLTLGHVSRRVSNLTHVTQPGAPPQSSLAAFYTDFLRQRITQAAHEVASEEVDKELIKETSNTAADHPRGPNEHSGLSSEIRDFSKQKTENEEKEDTCARVAEMTCCPLGGFGYFRMRLGTGTYNRERKPTIMRQFSTVGDALWGAGLRAPIGNRISHSASDLTWGALNVDKPGGEFVTLCGRIQSSAEAYSSVAADGKKYETRGYQPSTIDLIVRAARQRLGLLSLFSWEERKPWRMDVIDVFHRIREAQPDVSPLHFLIS